MAKLINIWRDDEPVKLSCKQMPLIIDESLTVSASSRAVPGFPDSWCATTSYVTTTSASSRNDLNLKKKKRKTRKKARRLLGGKSTFARLVRESESSFFIRLDRSAIVYYWNHLRDIVADCDKDNSIVVVLALGVIYSPDDCTIF